MRKLWFRRRAQATMVAGVVILSIFLIAIVAMILVSQQYDTYYSTVDKMQRTDVDKSMENLVAVYPGLNSTSGPLGLNQYVMSVGNYAGIGTRIVRIYVNSTSGGCSPSPCILDPSSAPAVYKFRASDALVNPGEYGHNVIMWFPSNVVLPPSSAANTIRMVTSRGNTFRFLWTFPTQGPGGGGWGGTGLNIGPLVIMYQSILITYSVYNGSNPNYPTPIDNGWIFPKSSLIIFIKIANQGLNPVTMLSTTTLQLQQFGTPSAPDNLYLIAPLDQGVCNSIAQKNVWNANLYCGYSPQPPQPGIGALPSNGNSYPTSNGGVYPYSPSQPYIVPAPAQPGVCCGPPVYMLFSASKAGGDSAYSISPSSNSPSVYYSFINLVFQYDNGSGVTYVYGINLPFVVFCASSTNPSGPYQQSCPP